MEAVALNNTQWQLIRAFSFAKTESTQKQLQQILSDFFAKKVEDDMDELWDSGEWSEDKQKEILSSHLRTPYKSIQ